MAIADYLSRLEELRKTLAENIGMKGVKTEEKESLSSLVPKVLQIDSGKGGNAQIGFRPCRTDRHLVNNIVSGTTTEGYLESDTLLNPALSLADFVVSGPISDVKYINENLLQLQLTDVKTADDLSLQAKLNAYKHRNGLSEKWDSTVSDKLADFFWNLSGMTYVRNCSKNDDGVDTLSIGAAFPYHIVGVQRITDFSVRAASANFYVGGNSWISPTNTEDCSIKMNRKDAASYTVGWRICHTSDCGDALKIRWEGMAYYGDSSVNEIWELYILDNGDAFILIELLDGTVDGTSNFYGTGFTPVKEGMYSFYTQDYYGTSYQMVEEQYNIKHHVATANDVSLSVEFASLIGNTDGLVKAIYSTDRQDDNSFTMTMPISWSYNGTPQTSLVISGNSWIGIGGANENIRVNRRDAALYESDGRLFILTDMKDLKCFKITWKGASYYGGSIDQEWELYLFENGDAMIHLTARGSSTDGSYDFFGVAFSISPGGSVSFYRKNTEGTEWEILTEQYDVNKHLV